MNTDKLFHNQDEIMENIMLFSPMPVLQAIQDSFTESVLADMQEEDAEIFAEFIPVRKSGKSRYDKKAMKRKGSAKRFRDRSRKCAHEGHVWKTYHRGMSGDYAKRGKRLEKTGRPQKVNVHFTNGIPQDTFNLTETDVHEYYSVSTWDGYESMENFFQYMDNMNWEKIPSEVRFSVEWYAENPFTVEYSEPEYFEMNATLRKTQKTLSAEKAKEEYLKFKKRYQVFKRYAKKLRSLYEEMNAELNV